MKAYSARETITLSNSARKYLALYFASKGCHTETKMEKFKNYIKAHLFFSIR